MTNAGIDLGKRTVHVATADPTQRPRDWTVHTIEYKDPDWWQQLLTIIPPGSNIAAEPTGGNMIAPIAHLLDGHANLYLVNHATTGNVRKEHVSSAKTDEMDARALALIASWIDTPAQPRSVRPYSHVQREAAAALRLYIDKHRRLSKTATATTNRLHHIAFSLWPALDQQFSTWLRCVGMGAIDPAQIIALAEHPPDHWHHNAVIALDRLVTKLPHPIQAHPARASAARELAAELDRLEIQQAKNMRYIEAIINTPPFDEATRSWISFPSASPLYAASLHAATHGHLEDYSLSAFRSAVGTNPQGKRSGSTNKTRLSRSGYKPAAAYLHLWTLNLIQRDDNPIAQYFHTTSSKRALAAARNKLAAILYTVAIRKETCTW